VRLPGHAQFAPVTRVTWIGSKFDWTPAPRASLIGLTPSIRFSHAAMRTASTPATFQVQQQVAAFSSRSPCRQHHPQQSPAKPANPGTPAPPAAPPAAPYEIAPDVGHYRLADAEEVWIVRIVVNPALPVLQPRLRVGYETARIGQECFEFVGAAFGDSSLAFRTAREQPAAALLYFLHGRPRLARP
jgi:hypothetical protein